MYGSIMPHSVISCHVRLRDLMCVAIARLFVRSVPVEVTREDGRIFTMTLTYRKPGRGHPFGGFQARCHHHEPEVCEGKRGKYTLACRKEFKMENDLPDAARQTLELCQAWILRATEYDSRVGKDGHQRDSKDKVVFKAISGGIDGHGSSQQEAGKQADKQADKQAGKQADKQADKQPGAADSRAGTGTRAPCADTQPCWVCGKQHAFAECAEWQRSIEMSLAAREQCPAEQRPRASLIRDVGCKLGAGVEVTDVPGDGDCLFHALALGINRVHGISFVKDGLCGGVRLRALLLRFVSNSANVRIDGMAVQEWIRACHHESIDEYRARMRVAGGRRTWGGYLEVAFLAHAISAHRALTVAVLHRRRDAWAVYAATGPCDAAGFAVAWTGNHWMYAQLSQACWEQVRAWRARQ